MTESLPNNAIVPVPNTQKDFYNWPERRQFKTAQIASRSHELIFIGDSITHMFELPARGGRVWDHYFGTYQVANLGYGWDCTQNVLWRLQNGEFTNQHPRLVVLNIGTNNLTGNSGGRANSPAEIVEAISVICSLIHGQSPDTTILVMAVFPRGRTEDPIFAKTRELGMLIRTTVENRPGITSLDIGKHFLGMDGEIKPELMDDLVHPTTSGYQIWAEHLHPFVVRYLQASH